MRHTLPDNWKSITPSSNCTEDKIQIPHQDLPDLTIWPLLISLTSTPITGPITLGSSHTGLLPFLRHSKLFLAYHLCPSSFTWEQDLSSDLPMCWLLLTNHVSAKCYLPTWAFCDLFAYSCKLSPFMCPLPSPYLSLSLFYHYIISCLFFLLSYSQTGIKVQHSCSPSNEHRVNTQYLLNELNVGEKQRMSCSRLERGDSNREHDLR